MKAKEKKDRDESSSSSSSNDKHCANTDREELELRKTWTRSNSEEI